MTSPDAGGLAYWETPGITDMIFPAPLQVLILLMTIHGGSVALDLKDIPQLKESHQLEAKLALGGLPDSLWETYSSFANSDGGTLLLGVKETTGNLQF